MYERDRQTHTHRHTYRHRMMAGPRLHSIARKKSAEVGWMLCKFQFTAVNGLYIPLSDVSILLKLDF